MTSDRPDSSISPSQNAQPGASRRSFIKHLALGGAAIPALTHIAGAQTRPAEALDGKDGFSFVHLTDMHVRRKRKGHLGYTACIESVNALSPRPDFALMGGDLAFDGLYTEKDEFEDQIGLYKEITAKLAMPYYHSIGNHDVLGLNARRKVPIDDPDIGKRFIMDRLGMDKSYYSFDHNGWHFVVLDSIHRIEADHGPGYIPKIGQEQLDWLRYDLGAAAGKPTVAMTHVAAFCNRGQIEGDPEAKAMTGMVLADTKELREILERHKVKALLQGHSHVPEDYCYNGVWYLTSPAVSAAWWGGNWKGQKPGYTLFTTRGDDLTWERRTFEWEHQLEPEDTLERQRIAEREAFEAEQARLLAEERAAAASSR